MRRVVQTAMLLLAILAPPPRADAQAVTRKQVDPDPIELYTAVYRKAVANHYKLADATTLQAFTAHFAPGKVKLSSLDQAVEKAIELLQSLNSGDRLLDRWETRTRQWERHPLRGVAAFTLELQEDAQLNGQLPAGASRRDKQRLFRVEAPHLLQVCGSRAEGLQRLDIIREIDGQSVEGMSLDEASTLILGLAGDKVSLLVQRPHTEFAKFSSEDKPAGYRFLDTVVSLAPADPPTATINVSTDKGFITIAVNAYHPLIFPPLMAALDEAEEKNQGLLLNLHMHADGDFEVAFGIAEMLLKEGVLCRTDTRQDGTTTTETIVLDGDESHIERISGQNTTTKPRIRLRQRFTGPLVVLIDHDTKVPGQLLARALQANKRATIVGQQLPEGAPVHRKIYDLPHGWSIELTNSSLVAGERSPTGSTERILEPDAGYFLEGKSAGDSISAGKALLESLGALTAEHK